MRAGDKLLTLLAKANVSQSEVARRLHRAPPAVKRYVTQLNEGTLPTDKWMALSAVLLELQIPAEEIRPLPILVSRPTGGRDLVPLLDSFKPEQIETVLRILNGRPDQIDILKAVAEDRVKRR